MLELPPFVVRANARSGRKGSRCAGSIPESVRELYEEFHRCSGTPGWLESPRGVWVSYQLDWVEGRC